MQHTTRGIPQYHSTHNIVYAMSTGGSGKSRKRQLDEVAMKDNKAAGARHQTGSKEDDDGNNSMTGGGATSSKIASSDGDAAAVDDGQRLASALSSSEIRRLRLEAIFHPKFENETRNNQEIRELMCERVAQGSGHLEVTIKHSGSLLLWSGGQQYYSKNSTENKFTHVGEILLRQHFVRSYWTGRNDDSANKQASGDQHVHAHTHTSKAVDEVPYKECSDYIEKTRLTLAFEVVTSCLGDHGERPKRDYLILTAVADKKRERFYSTSETMKLAQRFRLPHNDAWLFLSTDSVNSLFSFYDSFRETGLVQDVYDRLTPVSDAHVPSMYPHADFQGDIVEGIVIRYVPFSESTKEATVEDLKRLSECAVELNTKNVPPALADCFDLVAGQPDHLVPAVVRTNIRKVFEEADGYRMGASSDEFERSLRELLVRSEDRRSLERIPRSVDVDVPSMLNNLRESNDEETCRIAALIRTLAGLNDRVEFSVFQENTTSEGMTRTRWLCIIHVMHDNTFPKYRGAMNEGDMQLFRGFAVELSDVKSSESIETVGKGAADVVGAPAETLMLKMKFLPYMVRTFCCRNGLRVLRKGSAESFTERCHDLLTRWGMSVAAREKWSPFFRGWGIYALDVLDGKSDDDELCNLPHLTETFYLSHLDHFQHLFDSGKWKQQLSADVKGSFRGLVVVVAIDRETAAEIADCIAERLGGAERKTNINKLSPAQMTMMREKGCGCVCSAAIDDGVGRLRKHLQEFGEGISVVIYRCSDEDISRSLLPAKQSKKLGGMRQAWEAIKCAYTVAIPSSSSSPDGVTDSSSVVESKEFQDMIGALQEVSDALPEVDARPGLLVFFPGIPGCGKSSLVDGEFEADMCNKMSELNLDRPRELIVRVGDKVKDKYWPLVKLERLQNPPSIYAADKNAPASAWGLVAAICAATKGVGAPVLPGGAMRTTQVEGIRSNDGTVLQPTRSHIYPFSLAYLAICMLRVLERPAGSHDGKLDASTKRAGLVVVKFFALYRKISAENFNDVLKEKFSSAGALILSTPIEVPFVSPHKSNDSADHLPADLESVLLEALQAQYGYDLEKIDTGSHKVTDPYLDDLETRLREAVSGRHRDFLHSLVAVEAESRKFLTSQLIDCVGKVDALEEEYDGFAAAKEFFKIASIDIEFASIATVIEKLAAKEQAPAFLTTILGEIASKLRAAHGTSSSGTNENADTSSTSATPSLVTSIGKIVGQPHVTMAHFRQLSQSDMKATFQPLSGSRVQVKVLRILWSDRVAAFAVEIPTTAENGEPLPAALNAFPHITVWCSDGARAAESNDLPQLVKAGEAYQLVLAEPIMLTGVVSLWASSL